MDKKLQERIEKRLEVIYKDDETIKEALVMLEEILKKYDKAQEKHSVLSEKESILITYGDTIVDGSRPGLEVLHEFMNRFVKDAVGAVHLLPMYPYTSDDGFSVVDYREINPKLGTWEDVKKLSEDYGLMFDAVINHISKSSRWFQGYLQGEEPYKDYFITCDPNADYSKVTRPRALPLLTKFDTVDGEKYVWTTFSDDQIDLNFGCPKLLAEILDILIMYARNGAEYIRLDAIGFMWKELGTTCMHLPQTHEIIKLMKDVLGVYAPGTKIITETNVPHKDNVSYFGENGDEADLVYQFPLPPLVMYTMITGNARILSEWLEMLELPCREVTFFNFLSSHDGIGVRPVEGILSSEQRDLLVHTALKNGGEVSYKDNGDGTKSPYELNINYQDALADPDASDEERIGKFLAAETILLSLQGVPGIYIHSLLGSRNAYYERTVSGIPRRINRERLDLGYLVQQLSEETNRARIFHEFIGRLSIRKEEKAFSPLAEQKILHIADSVLTLIRKNPDTGDKIHVLINVSDNLQEIGYEGLCGRELLSGLDIKGAICLKPWQCAWVKEQ